MPKPPAAVDNAELIERALRWCEVFSQWPRERLAALMKSARLERYGRRTQVLAHDRQRRELLAVVSGCLEISCVSAGGHKYLNSLLGPGRVAPLVRLLEDVPLPYDYHALEDSVIIHLPCDAVIAQLDAEPVLWREIARLGLQRQRASVEMLQKQLLASNRQRVAGTLVSLAQLYGTQQPQGLSLSIRLSQTDLAAMLGVSRQTMNKELGVLVAEGLIGVDYKRIALTDVPRLQAIADGH